MRALAAALVAILAFAGPVRGAEQIIVAFGDSLTAGLGVTPEDSYPARLQTKLRAEGYAYRVVNAGSSGDTTAGGLRRVDWALKNKPEIVIVAVGANDGLRGQDLASVEIQLISYHQMMSSLTSGGVVELASAAALALAAIQKKGYLA